MNSDSTPTAGGASLTLQQFVRDLWIKTATAAGQDVAGFDPRASLEDRLTFMAAHEIAVGAGYSRFSSKHQGSTEDQWRSIIEFAARSRIYVPPEFACVDEAKSGRKDRRAGLTRLRALLDSEQIQIVLIFRLSRLFRLQHKAVAFVREEVVDRGYRAIAVAQGIDTADERQWKLQVAIHGIMDEQLLEAISVHVRQGKIGIFEKGWTTGPLPIGYHPVEVPGAPRTRRDHPRTRPEKTLEVAELILKHYRWIDEGLAIVEGLRRWIAENGPVDPRSTTRQMTYHAYVRMLTREEYKGMWKISRTRTFWDSRSDSVKQVRNRPDDVRTLLIEDLRIVPDDLFDRVKDRVESQKYGPRPRRTSKRIAPLWDRLNHTFVCAQCKRRLHTAGSKCQYLKCPSVTCPAPALMNKKDAVQAIITHLGAILGAHTDLANQIVEASKRLPQVDVTTLEQELKVARHNSQQLAARMRDLEDLLGVGDEAERARRKSQIIVVDSERSRAAAQVAALQRQMQRKSPERHQVLTVDMVKSALLDLPATIDRALLDGADGPTIARAAGLIERLVGGMITVVATRRPARKRWLIAGRFTISFIGEIAQHPQLADTELAGVTKLSAIEQEVELRPLPRLDIIAAETKELYEVQGLGFRVIAQQLKLKYGKPIGSGNVHAAYIRYYESRGIPVPPRREKHQRRAG